ncbi:MAG: IMP dehydrogenase [Elusimicrobiota bacterium]
MMKEGFTFNDVLLVPKRSSVASRKQVDPAGRFSRNIVLAAPIVSANMDTVTESQMAIAMARLGGLGIIHRFLTIQEQASQTAKVKAAQNVVIEDPCVIFPENSIAEAEEIMESRGIGGLLVVDKSRTLIGIVTGRDVRFETDKTASVGRVMSRDLTTAAPGISLDDARKIFAAKKIEKIPLVDKKGRLAGLITAKDLRMKERHPRASKDARGRLLAGAAIGVVGDYLERAQALLAAGADVLVIDVAHGHADHAIKAVKSVKKKWPRAELVAGNVATYAGAKDLALAGADGVKIGVGPGSLCSTRIVTGCGVPQLSAILDCARLTRRFGVPIIADGGIRDSGGMAKSLAAGASCVMLGSLLAGTDESPGWTIVRGGMRYKMYRGMASLGASISRRKKESAEHEEIDAEDVAALTPEGVEATVPYRGPVSDVIDQLLGGLRSGMSYVGARTLSEFRRRAEFVRLTPSSWEESKPHGLKTGGS